MTDKEIFDEMLSLIKKHGELRSKKHGNWIIWRFCGGGYFMSLDTWNSNIQLKQGSGEYNQWNGFEGEQISNFGIDFGGFEPKNHAQLKNLLEVAKSSIENMKKFDELLVQDKRTSHDSHTN